MPFADEQAGGLAIAAYDPKWPSEFGRLAIRIAAILAPVAEHIDHVGSTAVPGLAAKDCIDIQIRVPRLNEAMLAPPFAEPTVFPADHHAERAHGLAMLHLDTKVAHNDAFQDSHQHAACSLFD